MKKILFFLILIALGIWGYLGFVKVPEKMFFVTESKFRGQDVLNPGDWNFYPEVVVPGWLSIQKVPEKLSFSSDLTVALPYSKILSTLNDYKIQLGFSGSFQWNLNNINQLYSESLSDFKENLEKELSRKLKEIIVQNFNNPQFSRQMILAEAQKKLQSAAYRVSVQVTHFPDWPSYYRMTSRIKNWFLKNSEQVVVDLAVNQYRQSISRKAKKDDLKQSFTLIKETAEKISESKNPDLFFKLLDYLKITEK